jgi:hypothetical protein
MTTEILRSMFYRGSEVMREVAWIVMDEVHYLRDRERGVVWEESIVMAPKNARFVFLSATVPNAREFADWVAKVRSRLRLSGCPAQCVHELALIPNYRLGGCSLRYRKRYAATNRRSLKRADSVGGEDCKILLGTRLRINMAPSSWNAAPMGCPRGCIGPYESSQGARRGPFM